MKLCDYRAKRNAASNCLLYPHDIAGERNWRAPPVFAKEGKLPNERDFWGSYKCTEKMAEVCPYRKHIPRPKAPKCQWIECEYCDGRHRTEKARLTCKGYAEWRHAMKKNIDEVSGIGWVREGTKEEVYAQDVLAFKGFQDIRATIWPWMQYRIVTRDKKTCQDCGVTVGAKDADGNCVLFEVHHIIPRGLGGSDHPKNLKLVCQTCHKKYNQKFNSYIKKFKRAKAQDLRTFGGTE